MIYFTVPLSALRTPQYLQSSDPQRVAWVHLLAYCYEQGNDGVIGIPDEWDDDAWRSLGLKPEVVKAPSKLWSLNGMCLTVHFYSVDLQRVYEAKVRGGRAGAAKRWEKHRREQNRLSKPLKSNGTHP